MSLRAEYDEQVAKNKARRQKNWPQVSKFTIRGHMIVRGGDPIRYHDTTISRRDWRASTKHIRRRAADMMRAQYR